MLLLFPETKARSYGSEERRLDEILGVGGGGVKVSGMEALRRGHFCKSPIKAGELLSGTVVCGGCQEPPTARLFARPHFTIAASSSQNLHGDQKCSRSSAGTRVSTLHDETGGT